MQRIITLTVRNRSGVLNRVTGMLHRRQFNIESISVGATETKGVSKMTLVVDITDPRKIEQITKKLNKQIHVIKVTGKPNKTEALIALLRPYGIKELSKTGVTAFLRGQQPQDQSTDSHLFSV